MVLCANCGKSIGIFEKQYSINTGKKVCKACFENICYGIDCKEKVLDLEARIISFVGEYFGTENAKVLFDDELEALGIASIKTLTESQLMEFIDSFIEDIFTPISSIPKRGVLKAKLASILNISHDNARWQSVDQRGIKR